MTNGKLFNGERAKCIRRQKGLSILDVSGALHISPAAYSRYESGKREPSYAVCVMLADLLGCSLGYLMGDEDQPGSGRVILSPERAKQVRRALRDIADKSRELLDEL